MESSIELLISNSDRKVLLTELLELWQKPPFGMKKRAFPINKHFVLFI